MSKNPCDVERREENKPNQARHEISVDSCVEEGGPGVEDIQ